MQKSFTSALFFIAVSTSIAKADYVQIANGPPLEVAKAICDNASMGVGEGYFAFGSTSFVIGAGIGNAIGNLIMQERYKSNCMVIHGWKYTSATQSRAKPTQTYIRKTKPLSNACQNAKSLEQMTAYCK